MWAPHSPVWKFKSHPLIYTPLEFDLLPSMVVCQVDLRLGYDNEVEFLEEKGDMLFGYTLRKPVDERIQQDRNTL